MGGLAHAKTPLPTAKKSKKLIRNTWLVGGVCARVTWIATPLLIGYSARSLFKGFPDHNTNDGGICIANSEQGAFAFLIHLNNTRITIWVCGKTCIWLLKRNDAPASPLNYLSLNRFKLHNHSNRINPCPKPLLRITLQDSYLFPSLGFVFIIPFVVYVFYEFFFHFPH